eukprot:Rhum_TRINITY_DN13534_c0_g2::Rhum_TRINITY_DN13534_c0_g2_i1::g.61028::m.61028
MSMLSFTCSSTECSAAATASSTYRLTAAGTSEASSRACCVSCSSSSSVRISSTRRCSSCSPALSRSALPPRASGDDTPPTRLDGARATAAPAPPPPPPPPPPAAACPFTVSSRKTIDCLMVNSLFSTSCVTSRHPWQYPGAVADVTAASCDRRFSTSSQYASHSPTCSSSCSRSLCTSASVASCACSAAATRASTPRCAPCACPASASTRATRASRPSARSSPRRSAARASSRTCASRRLSMLRWSPRSCSTSRTRCSTSSWLFCSSPCRRTVSASASPSRDTSSATRRRQASSSLRHPSVTCCSRLRISTSPPTSSTLSPMLSAVLLLRSNRSRSSWCFSLMPYSRVGSLLLHSWATSVRRSPSSILNRSFTMFSSSSRRDTTVEAPPCSTPSGGPCVPLLWGRARTDAAATLGCWGDGDRAAREWIAAGRIVLPTPPTAAPPPPPVLMPLRTSDMGETRCTGTEGLAQPAGMDSMPPVGDFGKSSDSCSRLILCSSCDRRFAQRALASSSEYANIVLPACAACTGGYQ